MTAETTTKSSAPAAPPAPEMVHMTIDGQPVEVEKGTLLIRAAEQVGVRIPRFCDHPPVSYTHLTLPTILLV